MKKTTNYHQFKFIKSNRLLRQSKVNRLKKSMEKIGYIESMPITVNEHGEIMDGQHRFMACKDLNIPVNYVVVNGDANEIMIELNKNNDVWRLNDYILHYAKLDIKYHKEIFNFEEKYKLGISNAIIICSDIHCNPQSLREGIDLKLYPKREELYLYLQNFNDLYFYKNAKFILSITKFHKKATQEMLKKLVKYKAQITHQAAEYLYMNTFENIINKGLNINHKIKL